LSDYEGYKSAREQDGNYVFRLDANGTLDIVFDDFEMPNGIAFSPDEKHLFVSDTGKSKSIRVFDIGSDGKPVNGRTFAQISPGGPDGFRFDTEGNLWTSAGDGVHCYSPVGELLGKVLVPEKVANVEFGGLKRNRLFITATTSLYAIYLSANGARRP
jgi:gluconolactonase